jgi:hypothetical protein
MVLMGVVVRLERLPEDLRSLLDDRSEGNDLEGVPPPD